jgi:hypothetical protein
MTTPIEITVVCEANTWKIRYGSVELDYSTQAEALADAIAIARAFGKAGEFSAVRSGVMTTVYGPDGFIRAVPSAKLPPPTASTRSKEVGAGSAPKKTPASLRASKVPDERERVSRIASAFDITRGGPA